MSAVWVVALLICVANSFEIGSLGNNRDGAVVVPAQWTSRLQGVLLAWPTFDVYPDSPTHYVLTDMFAQITNGASENKVFLLVGNNDEYKKASDAIDLFNLGVTYGGVRAMNPINKTRVVFVNIPHTDLWMRDYLSIGKSASDAGKYAIVDFDFNAWGFGGEYKADASNFIRVSNYFNSISSTDTQIAPKFASFIEKTQKLPVTTVPSWLRKEPGGLEFNNDGVNPESRRLFVSEAYLAQPERNDGKTIYELLKELYRVYSLQEIILLPKFRFNRLVGAEEMVEQCPLTEEALNAGGQERWAHCFDPNSYYYTGAFGGGLVADDAPFIGTLKNEDSMERRRLLGFSDPVYDNVITSLTTNGHTDEWIRWVGPNVVLLGDIPGGRTAPKSSIDGRTWFRLNAVHDILKRKNIEVIRVPMPVDRVEYFGPGSCPYDGILDMRFTKGEYYDASKKEWVSAKGVQMLSIFPKGSKVPFISARSYLNYVMTDDYVLIPEYCSVDGTKESCDRDQAAKKIIASVFGNMEIKREVVQISNVDKLNFCGGGMHCITQHYFK